MHLSIFCPGGGGGPGYPGGTNIDRHIKKWPVPKFSKLNSLYVSLEGGHAGSYKMYFWWFVSMILITSDPSPIVHLKNWQVPKSFIFNSIYCVYAAQAGMGHTYYNINRRTASEYSILKMASPLPPSSKHVKISDLLMARFLLFTKQNIGQIAVHLSLSPL